MPVEFGQLRTDRRGFLKFSALTMAAIAFAQIPDQRQIRLSKLEEFSYEPNKIGVNILPEAAVYYGLDQNEVLDTQLGLPFGRARIPIRFSQVSPSKGVFDFRETDNLVDKIIMSGKQIDLQIGIKTIGYPEVHVPSWLYNEFPYLRESGVQLDSHPQVRDYTLEYLKAVWEHYSKRDEIVTVQVENEPYSKLLDVARFRYLSYEFNQEEIDLIKTLDSKKRQILQNFPWDNPSVWPSILTNPNLDIIGINVYNNIYNDLLNSLLWSFISYAFSQAEDYQKGVHITEYQTAPWLDHNKNPKYPFDSEKREEGLKKLMQLNPDGLHLWDLPQLIWRAKNGDKETEKYLYHDLPKLAA